jgi:hypothetical protein
VTLAAATATAGHGSPWPLVLIGLALTVIWLGSLFLKPYTSCRSCHGSGRRGTSSRYGRCRWCKGDPERLRFGARLVHRNLGGK